MCEHLIYLLATNRIILRPAWAHPKGRLSVAISDTSQSGQTDTRSSELNQPSTNNVGLPDKITEDPVADSLPGSTYALPKVSSYASQARS